MADDPINHPKHYTSSPSGVECIDVIRHMTFNLGTAVKFIWRAGVKDEASHIMDLQKAAWYLNNEIERLRDIPNMLFSEKELDKASEK